jgi:hypothetical protein
VLVAEAVDRQALDPFHDEIGVTVGGGPSSRPLAVPGRPCYAWRVRSIRDSGLLLRLGLPLAVAVALALFAWLGRTAPPEPDGTPPEPRLADAAELGSDRGAGNLLGIQPFMLPHDYASEEAFYAKLAAYFAAADARGWLGEGTVVILPARVCRQVARGTL